MFEPVQENFRKTAESTLQFQQELLRFWTQPWAQVAGVPADGTATGWGEQLGGFQKKWAEAVIDTLNKHRETLDAQYQAGIRTIEDACRVGQAKDPEQFRKLVEELWRQGFACLKTVAEVQMRETQAATQKWIETVSQGPAVAQA